MKTSTKIIITVAAAVGALTQSGCGMSHTSRKFADAKAAPTSVVQSNDALASFATKTR